MTKSFDERNALKSRRVCEAMAEAESTGKRVLTERERQILAMWPRFEDGEPVMPGDKVHYASAYNDETEIEVESITTMDGCFVLCDDGCRSNQYEQGQRVKRPVQSVLDAGGVEIKVGDTVWHEDGSEQLVEEMNRYGVRCFDGDKRRTFNPKYLTHTRPAPKVLDADGAEIKLGDTVWHCIGIYDELVVEEIDDESGWVRTRSANGACLSAYHTHLTHTRPDSWELLEEDASKDACMYFGTKYFNCGECPADGANCFGRMKSDLIRRAKALAGVEVEA